MNFPMQRVRSIRFEQVASLFFKRYVFVYFSSHFFNHTHTHSHSYTHTHSSKNELKGKSVNTFIFHANNIKQLNLKLMIKWASEKKNCVSFTQDITRWPIHRSVDSCKTLILIFFCVFIRYWFLLLMMLDTTQRSI